MRSVVSGFLNSSLRSVLCCHLVSDHPGLDSSSSRRQRAGQRAPPQPPPFRAQPPGLHLSSLSSPHHPPFFPSSPCSLHPPRLSLLFQTAAILPLFHLTLPRSSPRPVFIRVALTTHSSVGLIHHHHEERVRRVGTKTRGGGKVMHNTGRSQKLGVWTRREASWENKWRDHCGKGGEDVGGRDRG